MPFETEPYQMPNDGLGEIEIIIDFHRGEAADRARQAFAPLNRR